MTDQEILCVRTAIDTVVSKFHRTPNVFLTEDDLRVQLCSALLQHFGNEQRSRDGDVSIPVHAEVRWYGDGNLKIRSDIVLVDVPDLEVLHYAKMPSKGYGFNVPKAVIELKLRRPNGESDSQFTKKIQSDLRKLRLLRRRFREAKGEYRTQFWMVILDKKTKLQAIELTRDGIDIIYEFANTSAHNCLINSLKLAGTLPLK